MASRITRVIIYINSLLRISSRLAISPSHEQRRREGAWFLVYLSSLSPITMDALFAPLASASVDPWVKASRLPGRMAKHRLTRQHSAPVHVLLANCIPPRKPLHSDTRIPT